MEKAVDMNKSEHTTKDDSSAKRKKYAKNHALGHFAKAMVCKGSLHKIADERGDYDSSDSIESNCCKSDNDIVCVIAATLTTGTMKDEEIVKVRVNGKETLKHVNSGSQKTLSGITEFKEVRCSRSLHHTNVRLTPTALNNVSQ